MCNCNSNNLKIMNGILLTPAEKVRYNFFCSICPRYENTPFCGGSYIGKNYVITAAHCVNDFKDAPLSIQVQFNKDTLNSKGDIFDILKIIIYPAYNPENVNNDIAILVLDGIPSLSSINRILIPNSNIFYNIDRKNTIIGFGKTNTENQSNNLKKGIVKNICKENTFYHDSDITPSMFLAGDNKKIDGENVDSCQGDSGGSLFSIENDKLFLVGVTSWGKGCGLSGYPGIYTKVFNFRDWIKKHTGISFCTSHILD